MNICSSTLCSKAMFRRAKMTSLFWVITYSYEKRSISLLTLNRRIFKWLFQRYSKYEKSRRWKQVDSPFPTLEQFLNVETFIQIHFWISSPPMYHFLLSKQWKKFEIQLHSENSIGTSIPKMDMGVCHFKNGSSKTEEKLSQP